MKSKKIKLVNKTQKGDSEIQRKKLMSTNRQREEGRDNIEVEGEKKGY